MEKRVSADLHNEDGDTVEIFFELPEKKVLFPKDNEAGSLFWMFSPTP